MAGTISLRKGPRRVRMFLASAACAMALAAPASAFIPPPEVLLPNPEATAAWATSVATELAEAGGVPCGDDEKRATERGVRDVKRCLLGPYV